MLLESEARHPQGGPIRNPVRERGAFVTVVELWGVGLALVEELPPVPLDDVDDHPALGSGRVALCDRFGGVAAPAAGPAADPLVHVDHKVEALVVARRIVAAMQARGSAGRGEALARSLALAGPRYELDIVESIGELSATWTHESARMIGSVQVWHPRWASCFRHRHEEWQHK